MAARQRKIPGILHPGPAAGYGGQLTSLCKIIVCPAQDRPALAASKSPQINVFANFVTERIMGIAAQFRSLLDSCQEMAFSHLRPLIDRMFENADVALLDFAEKAESNMAQSVFFDAMNEVRKKRSLIEQHFYGELKRSFSEFPVRPNSGGPADSESGNLSLVDTETVETFVATQNAAGKLANRIMDRIFALKQRLAVVNGGNAIEENQIPGGPAWLGAAYQHAVEQLELENKVRLVFIALFDKYVLGRADTLFDEYNKRLIQADILPNLRYEVRKQSGGIEIVEKQLSDAEVDNEAGNTADDGSPDQNQTPSQLGDELFGRICDLMSGRRQRNFSGNSAGAGNVSPLRRQHGGGGFPAGGGTADAGDYESGPAGGGITLLGQISSLQAGLQRAGAGISSDEFIENIEIDQHLIDKLQNTLAGEREKIFESVDRRKLSSEDTDIIELVGMMFEYMLKDEQLPNIVKALLSRLHTPLLKVAVIDRSFFTHHGHAARKLLNDMTAAGIRWVEESHIDRGIFPKMKEIVDKVLLDFQEDVGLFDELLAEFTAAVTELSQRASRVEHRTNEAANGQEKLQAARYRVQQEVRALIQGKTIVQPACDFLQRILADKLTFILLRSQEGDGSAEWKQTKELAVRVLSSVALPADGQGANLSVQEVEALQQEIRDATSSLQQAEKEKILHALFEFQRSIANGADMEKIAAPLEVVADKPDDPTGGNAGLALSDEQQQMLDKLKDIPFGTWFEFRKPDEPKIRVKLSWRSTVTGKYMFVDQMGIKAAVVCMRELADCMLNGNVRIVSAEKKPFVDRALSAIHRMLDHAA
jgi:Protein of unknown function (DUF1631)